MRLAYLVDYGPARKFDRYWNVPEALKEVDLTRIGIDQIWFFGHHLWPAAPISSPETGTFRKLAHLTPQWSSVTQLGSCADYVDWKTPAGRALLG